MRKLACRLVVDLAQHDGNDQVALVGDRDALRESRLAVLHLEAVEPRAAEQVGDAHAAALLQGGELLVQEINVGHPVDFLVGHHAGVAVAAESQLGTDIDLEIMAAPGAARRPAVAREGPRRRPPAVGRLRSLRQPPVGVHGDAGQPRHRAGGQRGLHDGAPGQHRLISARPPGGRRPRARGYACRCWRGRRCRSGRARRSRRCWSGSRPCSGPCCRP